MTDTTENIPSTLAKLVVPVDGLTPYPRNPRRGDVDMIAESLSVHGQYRPIVVRAGSNEVLAGNHTLAAAKQLGWRRIAATFVDVDDDTAARIVLVDNRASDVAGYDDAVLADLLRGFDDLAGTGYDEATVADLLGEGGGPAPVSLTDPDDAPAAPVSPHSKPGDVWQLGPHRLVCGDATDPAAWSALLLPDERLDAVWTDPPYGVDYVGKTADALTIENDARDADKLSSLLTRSLGAGLERCDPGAAWYVAAPAGPATLTFAQVLSALGVWRQTLVWVKDQFVLGHSDYHYRHEIIYQGYGPPGTGRRGRGGVGWYGPNNVDSVLEVPRPSRSREHPTMKPVELITRCLVNSTSPESLVADPFGGSGSTLITCHQLRLIARLIELDPVYVDVICRRWQEHTGIVPVLEATGQPHDFTEAGEQA